MIKEIPLNKLVPSPRNVRRTEDAAADSQLKADIAARGLLQNLVVRTATRGLYEVECGERRRRQLVALADEGAMKKNAPITCLVVNGDDATLREISLAENFQRLAMNPADEADAFAAIIADGATIPDVARRFGLTTKFVEGRLRLASLHPTVFAALAAGEITLDMAKAYGATSDQERQAQVYEELQDAWYDITPDTIRRMILQASVTASDRRAKLVGRDAYVAAGGRIDRQLFDDDTTESWIDVAILERLAAEKMEEVAKSVAAEQGLAWVRPTLDSHVSYTLTEGLTRLPVVQAPLTEADIERLSALETEFDSAAAVIEDEDADDAAREAAEAEVERIQNEMAAIAHKPPVLDDQLKGKAGVFLTLGKDGAPELQATYFSDQPIEVAVSGNDNVDTGPAKGGGAKGLSQRLVDELAMQRRDILALHLASDPALALDVFVFALADKDQLDWRENDGLTLSGNAPSGPIFEFEAAGSPATVGLAELRSGLDESWRGAGHREARFDAYRALPDEARASWLGFVVARTLEASLNQTGGRSCRFHDHLGRLMGIEITHWWRPSAANFFDRVSKSVILDALEQVGGPDLARRYGSAKKGELAASAERIFAGQVIADVEVKDRALAWIPPQMAFAESEAPEATDDLIEPTSQH
jgi:ParB family chromosome partitioning protein